MSQPILGNTTFGNPTPGSSSFSIAHTQDSGVNRGLLVSLAQTNGISVSSVEYNGVALTQLSNGYVSSMSQRLSSFFLANPDSGSHNIVVHLSGSLWSPLSFAAYSFTNCSGYGDYAINTSVQNPNNIVLNCSNNSLIFGRGQAYQAAGNPAVTIDGVEYGAYYCDFQHNTNSQAWGKLGTNTVAAGNRTVSLDATSGGSAALAVEIKGAVSAVVPTLTTTNISNIGRLLANSGGNISSDGGASVTQRGVCWSVSSGPTISDSISNDGTGTGAFISSIINLNPNTKYYVRAYAQNSTGVGYGNELSFTTKRRIIISCS